MVWFDYDSGARGASPIAMLIGPGRERRAAGAGPSGWTAAMTAGPDAHGAARRGGRPRRADAKATGLEALAEVDDIAIVAAPDAGGLERCRPAVRRHAEPDPPRRAVPLPDRRRRRTRRAPRSTRSGPSAATSTRSTPRSTTRGSRCSTPPGRRSGRTDAAAAAAAVRLRHRHLRPQRHHPRCVQGAGQRGRVSGSPGSREHQPGPQRGAEPGAHQRPAVLPRPRQPGLGRADAQLGPASGSTSTSGGCSSSWNTRSTRRPSGRCSSRTVRPVAQHHATVKDFLDVQWRDGALLGATPEEAYFVLCDRSP